MPQIARYPSELVRPFRIESWSHDGVDHVLALALTSLSAPGGQSGKAWLLKWDAETGGARFGGAFLNGEDLMGIDRRHLASRIALAPAETEHYEFFGIPEGRKPGLRAAIRHAITQGVQPVAWPDPGPQDERDPPGIVMMKRGPATLRSLGDEVLRSPERWGYRRKPGPPPAMPQIRFREPPPMEPGRDVVAFQGKDPLVGSDRIEAAIDEHLAAATSTIRARLSPEGTAAAGILNWSRAAHDFYAVQGTIGERRRQAAALYPAFAPILAAEPEIARLIDAGRPYEDRLLQAVREFPSGAEDPKPTMAALRRLRGLAGEIDYRELTQLLFNAARLPSEWLPTTPQGWESFRAVMEGTNAFMALEYHKALSLRDLFEGYAGDWDRVLAETASRNGLFQDLLDAGDAVRMLRETLLSPVLRSLCAERLVDGFTDLNHIWEAKVLGELGASMLFGGKTVAGILKASRAWHRDRDRLEANLPAGGNQKWPPLLGETYRCHIHKDIEIVCLTDQAQLRAEGADRFDANGAHGLNHCVGGYGRQCFTGESHILSIRAPKPDGSYERLSTVEVRVAGNGEPKVAQHRGYGNSAPHWLAQEALKALGTALAEGRASLNPEALVKRDESRFDAAYDWQVPGHIEKAFAAWERHLPGRHAGLEGIRDLVWDAVLPTVPPGMLRDDAPPLNP